MAAIDPLPNRRSCNTSPRCHWKDDFKQQSPPPHDVEDEMNLLAVPKLKEVDGRFEGPSLFDDDLDEDEL